MASLSPVWSRASSAPGHLVPLAAPAAPRNTVIPPRPGSSAAPAPGAAAPPGSQEPAAPRGSGFGEKRQPGACAARGGRRRWGSGAGSARPTSPEPGRPGPPPLALGTPLAAARPLSGPGLPPSHPAHGGPAATEGRGAAAAFPCPHTGTCPRLCPELASAETLAGPGGAAGSLENGIATRKRKFQEVFSSLKFYRCLKMGKASNRFLVAVFLLLSQKESGISSRS